VNSAMTARRSVRVIHESPRWLRIPVNVTAGIPAT